MIKDLHSIARAKAKNLPTTGLFADKVPLGLYAIFDGQSSASSPPGPSAAEYCVRNFHAKLLGNLAMLPPEGTNEVFIKAALVKTFEDLDAELLANAEVKDGCGAACALIVGNYLFTAVVGKCNAVLANAVRNELGAVPLGKGSIVQVAEERRRLEAAGTALVDNGGILSIMHPEVGASSVSRSLGNREWKASVELPIVLCIPEVRSVALEGCEGHPFP